MARQRNSADPYWELAAQTGPEKRTRQIRHLLHSGIDADWLAEYFTASEMKKAGVVLTKQPADPFGWMKAPQVSPVEKIRAIRSEPRSATHRELAGKYGMMATTISDIRRRRSWRHLE